ncbi:beta-lactamase-like protein [Cladorrhinum sp. PSN332]|nr:beta-lactamase-like protein [Cladorrhinum sp. PSN332]
MASKRKAEAMAAAPDEPVDPSDELKFLNLGGGNEVGRSCHIIQYKGKTIMLDAGQHPGYDGLAGLPFFDNFDLSLVDVLLISHFHIDHAASLPYVLAKTNFRGRVFMTHPTKAIYKWLIQDSVRVGNMSSNPTTQLVYTEHDHLSTYPRIEAIDFHTTHHVSSVRITAYPAGHVLGAAMFLIQIADLNILFTGDYSREQDRHLVSAEIPKDIKIDVLITESTYGIATHIPRVEREQAMMKSITGVLDRGGRVLMPVFALGRAQELLLILDEYWGKHQEYQKYPIYYASNLARKCMEVYRTYIGAMNDNLRRLFRERIAKAEASGDSSRMLGPWDFQFVRSLKNIDRFQDIGGCVVLASPGMLQSGISRELLERWAPSDKNGVIITGYSVEGTMAKQIMQEPQTIQASGKNQVLIPRRCTVEEFSFAAHVDGTENREFIEEIAAPVVILVHGELHNMMKLKSKLLSLNAAKENKVKVFSPKNCVELRIPFKRDKVAKVVGKLASISPDQQQIVTGVLLQRNFDMFLMAQEDVRDYAKLDVTTIICKQRLRLSAAGIDLIKWGLEGTFGTIEELPEGRKQQQNAESNGDSKMEEADEEIPRDEVVAAYRVMGCVTVRYHSSGEVVIEWEGNMLNDGIADAVMAVLISIESSPAAVKQSISKSPHHHHHHGEVDLPPRNLHASVSAAERLERLMMFLEAQFGADNITPIVEPRLPPNTDVDTTMDGSNDSDPLKERQALELARLNKLGIPIPGLIIKVDKMVATVWLEELDIECESRVFSDRVRAVVERAVEVTAPLWG